MKTVLYYLISFKILKIVQGIKKSYNQYITFSTQFLYCMMLALYLFDTRIYAYHEMKNLSNNS